MEWTDVAADWPAYTESIVTRWPEADPEVVADMEPDREAFETYIAGVERVEVPEASRQVAQWLEGPKPIDAATDENHDDTSIRESAGHIPAGEDVYSEDRDFGDDALASNPVGRTT